MGRHQLFINPSNRELAIDVSQKVINKIQSYLLSETELVLISERDYKKIQTANIFIARNADESTQYNHAKDLLGFVINFKDTCNEGFIITFYRDYIANCPTARRAQILSELKSYSPSNSTSPSKTT